MRGNEFSNVGHLALRNYFFEELKKFVSFG